jgi:hypothetical protein
MSHGYGGHRSLVRKDCCLCAKFLLQTNLLEFNVLAESMSLVVSVFHVGLFRHDIRVEGIKIDDGFATFITDRILNALHLDWDAVEPAVPGWTLVHLGLSEVLELHGWRVHALALAIYV